MSQDFWDHRTDGEDSDAPLRKPGDTVPILRVDNGGGWARMFLAIAVLVAIFVVVRTVWDQPAAPIAPPESADSPDSAPLDTALLAAQNDPRQPVDAPIYVLALSTKLDTLDNACMKLITNAQGFDLDHMRSQIASVQSMIQQPMRARLPQHQSGFTDFNAAGARFAAYARAIYDRYDTFRSSDSLRREPLPSSQSLQSDWQAAHQDLLRAEAAARTAVGLGGASTAAQNK